jgi:flavin-binding protein dodecin
MVRWQQEIDIPDRHITLNVESEKGSQAPSSALPVTLTRSREPRMSDHVYKVVELVGSSTSSIEDAIQTAVKRADQTLRNLRWFEVVQTRGHVENGEVHHYQVVLKAGFTLEGESA